MQLEPNAELRSETAKRPIVSNRDLDEIDARARQDRAERLEQLRRTSQRLAQEMHDLADAAKRRSPSK